MSGPRITIVTPSIDPAPGAVRAIESVLSQRYSDLEHIAIAGEDAGALSEHYSHLKTIADPGRGPAAAINAGMAAATGDILAILDTDAVLLPGALDRVSREIDPTRRRHASMGRCRLLDGQGRVTGIEHPSGIESHRKMLEVWLRPRMRIAALFWTREAWRTSGPLDERAPVGWIESDLCSRLARQHQVHRVDEA